jgi:hypothetical protein
MDRTVRTVMNAAKSAVAIIIAADALLRAWTRLERSWQWRREQRLKAGLDAGKVITVEHESESDVSTTPFGSEAVEP